MDLFGLKRLVLAAGTLATAIIFLRHAGTMKALTDPQSLLLLGWCLLPYAHLWTFGRDDDPPISRLIMIGAAGMAAVFGTWVYVDMTVIHWEYHGALAFLIVPFMQMAVALPAILAAWIVRRRAPEPVAG